MGFNFTYKHSFLSTVLCVAFIFYFKHNSLFAQLIQAPNEIKNGLKEGLWNELDFMYLTDINGESKLVRIFHNTPEFVVAEGFFVNDYRHGVWKNYFIERYIDSGNTKYRKGLLKELYEVNYGHFSGKYVSYFKSGQVRLLGQYCIVEKHRVDTLQVPVGETDQVEDQIFESFYSSQMTGNWYEFEHSGELIQVKNYGKPLGCLQKLPDLSKIHPNSAINFQLK